MRIHEVVPGQLGRLNDRFATITLDYFAKHGIVPVAFWTDAVGVSNRLTYIVRDDDLAHRERAWTAFMTDPDRLAAFAKTDKHGPIVPRIENRLLSPTDYSPLP